MWGRRGALREGMGDARRKERPEWGLRGNFFKRADKESHSFEEAIIASNSSCNKGFIINGGQQGEVCRGARVRGREARKVATLNCGQYQVRNLP